MTTTHIELIRKGYAANSIEFLKSIKEVLIERNIQVDIDKNLYCLTLKLDKHTCYVYPKEDAITYRYCEFEDKIKDIPCFINENIYKFKKLKKDWKKLEGYSWNNSDKEEVMHILEENDIYLNWYDDYATDNYEKDDPNFPIFVCNWNHFSCSELKDEIDFESFFGPNIQWEDTTTMCDQCSGVILFQDEFCWQSEGGSICETCVTEDPIPFINSIIDEPDRACSLDIDLEEHGFTQMQSDFETGLYSGMNDDPHSILQAKKDEYPNKEFIFKINSSNPFMCSYSIYGRDTE